MGEVFVEVIYEGLGEFDQMQGDVIVVYEFFGQYKEGDGYQWEVVYIVIEVMIQQCDILFLIGQL